MSEGALKLIIQVCHSCHHLSSSHEYIPISYVLSTHGCMPTTPAGLSALSVTCWSMGSATGWDGWDTSHPIFLLFNTTPMGVAWKESTSEGLRPLNIRRVAGSCADPVSDNQCLPNACQSQPTRFHPYRCARC